MTQDQTQRQRLEANVLEEAVLEVIAPLKRALGEEGAGER